MVRVQLVHHYKVILQQRLTLKFFAQKPVEYTLFDFYLINVYRFHVSGFGRLILRVVFRGPYFPNILVGGKHFLDRRSNI